MNILFILALRTVTSLHVRSSSQQTLRQWLTDGRCFNMVFTPQYNNQHSMFGITDSLQEQKMFENLGGLAAGSGGTLPAAFVAAGSNFTQFSQHFPKQGWGGLGPSEPKITEDYSRLLAATLPRTFEELKYPLGISLTHWDDTKSLKTFDNKKQRGFAVGKGNLHDAMTAAVVTSGAHPSCPNCTTGFWPRRVGDKYPVTDGAFGDAWGARGLEVLPKCEKVLQLLPLDYPEQVDPPPAREFANLPKEIVSLVIVQPPIASHGYILEKFPMMHKLISNKSPEYWNGLMYHRLFNATPDALDDELRFKPDSDGFKQAALPVQSNLKSFETFPEQIYDRVMSVERDRFWAFYLESGRKAWGDFYAAFQIHNKVNARHLKRLYKDMQSGEFSPFQSNDNAETAHMGGVQNAIA